MLLLIIIFGELFTYIFSNFRNIELICIFEVNEFINYNYY